MRKFFIFLLPFLLIVVLFEFFNGFWFKPQLERNLLYLNALYDIDIQIDPSDYYSSADKISYIRNDYGLRTNCKNPENVDIVIIGGSTTDQRYIGFENSFSYLLQEKLSQNSERDYCIANAGVDGHQLSTHINSLENWFPLIPSFNPSYYVLNIGLNDAVLTKSISDSHDSVVDTFSSRIKFAIMRNSYLYAFIKKIRNLIGISTDRYGVLTHKKNIGNEFEYSAVKRSNEFEDDIVKNSIFFGEKLNEAIDIIKRRDAMPICVSQNALFTREGKGIGKAFPYNDSHLNGLDLQYSLELINNQIRTICSQKGGIVVDIDKAQFSIYDFYDFVHHSPSGSTKLAELIFASIKDKL